MSVLVHRGLLLPRPPARGAGVQQNRPLPLGWLLALLLAAGGLPAFADQENIRTAKVAGAFYPADPIQLRAMVAELLQNAGTNITGTLPHALTILLLPHAGYPYSGPIAAQGFKRLSGGMYDAVVVVGFTHRQRFDGTSVDDRQSYETPLGQIPVDQSAVEFLMAQPGLHHVEEAHASDEHSLEVMLPFLQVAMERVRLVPLLMGTDEWPDAEALADALSALARRGRYLFIFSTDLSHYHPYEEAVQRDGGTLQALQFELPVAVSRLFGAGALEACGRGPILAALALGSRLGLRPRLLSYANSGDTTGDKDKVVGYAAMEFHAEDEPGGADRLSEAAGIAMVRAARAVVEAAVMERGSDGVIAKGVVPEMVALGTLPELGQPRGLFITLRKDGALRGCIGRIESDVPMATLLPTVAVESALHDDRFGPVSPDELKALTVEVSVLSPPTPIRNAQEIVAGRDGVVLRQGVRGGVFLPQVWHETGWTRLEFLRELASQKAGLAPDAWREAQLFTFRDQAFSEEVRQ